MRRRGTHRDLLLRRYVRWEAAMTADGTAMERAKTIEVWRKLRHSRQVLVGPPRKTWMDRLIRLSSKLGIIVEERRLH